MKKWSRTPRYKTLEIIKFYDRIYEFVSRYVIFVISWILSIMAVLIIWVREPNLAAVSSTNTTFTGTSDAFVQEPWLIYPVNYFAGKLISFDGNNNIYGLGWPIWSTQQLTWPVLRNSIDNIVQYNWVILPRQISRSAWVPEFTKEWYSVELVQTFLEWMWSSQVDISSIQSSIKHITKKSLSESMFKTFSISCTKRMLFIRDFCDLKLQDSISTRNSYDLSGSVSELQTIKEYVFSSNSSNIQTLFCNEMIKQYRYSGKASMAAIMNWCSEEITNEAAYIGYMIDINQEVKTNKFTNRVYNNIIINQYKLMSVYQYLMSKIQWGEYINEQDDNILHTYGSYIVKLANNNLISQPYWDIITVFHNKYLIPWLTERNVFASTYQKGITQELIDSTNLLINWDASKWFKSITEWSRLRENWEIGWLLVNQSPPIGVETPDEVIMQNTGYNENSTTSGETTTTTWEQANTLWINQLIKQVLWSEPQSVTKNWTIIIVKYSYKSAWWIASIDLSQKWLTQLYFDSPDFGATKITHPQVIFANSNTELIIAIMSDYLTSVVNKN